MRHNITPRSTSGYKLRGFAVYTTGFKVSFADIVPTISITAQTLPVSPASENDERTVFDVDRWPRYDVVIGYGRKDVIWRRIEGRESCRMEIRREVNDEEELEGREGIFEEGRTCDYGWKTTRRPEEANYVPQKPDWIEQSWFGWFKALSMIK